MTDYIWQADDFLWDIAIFFIVIFGIYATIRYKGLQITRLKHAVSLTLGDAKTKNKSGSISSFEAFCISMGARIGVGNIAGTASAIITGGPGAIFWMWIFAIIGSASSFVETVIGQLYKEKKSDGECYGGPAYYASKGFHSRKAGIVVAFIIFIMFAVGFAGIECCNASDALCNAFEFDNNELVFALIITGLFAPIALGGARRVAKVSAKIIPVMALGWIVFGLVVILVNFANIPNAFGMIFYYAFNENALIGGGIGSAIMMGMRRGVFSNEAGIGTVTGISSTANVEHPAKQGYIQSFGVLVDTLIISTFSAIIILSFGDFASIHALPEFVREEGVGLLQDVSVHAIGDVAKYLVAFFVFIFAFTCLVSDYLTSEINIRFIKDHKYCIWGLRIFLICMVFFACMAKTEEMFDLLDICMAVTGIVNIICISLLAKQAKAVYDDYEKQRAAGV
ncbi:MAG: alanine:cation symporter family protein, partial [archaeon]|nr:alanine:cation symporter family protein [archaeon]